MRAGLVFVIASLLVGQGFREWERSHQTALHDLVRELEAEDARTPDIPKAPSDSGTPVPARHREVPVGRIDPNRASVAELVRLPGIGPALAGRIVADRDQRGPFGSAEGLRRVRGIGPKTLDRIRGFLSFPPNGGDSLTGF